jgi:hypothetical protein
MKKDKDKIPPVPGNLKQTIKPTKNEEDRGIKTPVTDVRKNTVNENVGLNQSKTDREDLLPPD